MLTDELQQLSLDGPAPQQDSPSSTSSLTKSRPLFFPPLWLARRTACMQALRKEGVRSAAEFGCGQGAVLSLLTLPAQHLDEFPSLYPPAPYTSSPSSPSAPTALRTQKLDVLRSIPRRDPTENELHLNRVIGVDINHESLLQARKVVEPPKQVEKRAEDEWSPRQPERWEELSVQLYEGGLEVYNESLENIEAMVLTEVIEHLTPAAFSKFPHIIFNVYSPRLVIITTPNHDFNPYFVPSAKDDESLHRFPDPTGRTNRVFRDADHRFEMTQAEFQEWANKAAGDDYDVTFSGVGSLSGYFDAQNPKDIPFPPPSLDAHPALVEGPASLAVPTHPNTFYATQIAIFEKIIPNEAERSPRSQRPTPLPFFSSPHTATVPLPGSPSSPTTPILTEGSSNTGRPPFFSRQSTSPTPHKLVYSATHPVHPSAGVAAPWNIILRELARVVRSRGDGEGGVTLRQAWGDETMREMCGGTIGAIVDAVIEGDEEGEWEFERIEERQGDDALRIVWGAWEPDMGAAQEVREDEDEDEPEGQEGAYAEVGETLGVWEAEESEGWEGPPRDARERADGW